MMNDINFQYRINDEYLFESLAFQDFICFNLFNKCFLKISCIAWQFDSKQDLNDFMVKFVKENFKRGYNDSWSTVDCSRIEISYKTCVRSKDAVVSFQCLQDTDCFPKLKEALTKHYCPELLENHSTDVKTYAFFDSSKHVVDANELIINGVKYRRVE
jgi:hypothetical protein